MRRVASDSTSVNRRPHNLPWSTVYCLFGLLSSWSTGEASRNSLVDAEPLTSTRSRCARETRKVLCEKSVEKSLSQNWNSADKIEENNRAQQKGERIPSTFPSDLVLAALIDLQRIAETPRGFDDPTIRYDEGCHCGGIKKSIFILHTVKRP